MSGMLGHEFLEPDPSEPEVLEPVWTIAQMEPGLVNNTWWAIIDTRNRFVRGRFYGRDNAQLVIDLLSENRTSTNDMLEEIAQRAEAVLNDVGMPWIGEQIAALTRSKQRP